MKQLDFCAEEIRTKYSGAILDPSQRYRYALWRTWDESLPRITFIMLNPSTADQFKDDPTLRRCITFAKRFGGGSVEVVNLFAYRSTQPSELALVDNPVGPENDAYILAAVRRSALLIAAWGVHGMYTSRCLDVINLIRSSIDKPVYCLGVTKEQYPRHPLYVRSDTQLCIYG